MAAVRLFPCNNTHQDLAFVYYNSGAFADQKLLPLEFYREPEEHSSKLQLT